MNRLKNITIKDINNMLDSAFCLSGPKAMSGNIMKLTRCKKCNSIKIKDEQCICCGEKQ